MSARMGIPNELMTNEEIVEKAAREIGGDPNRRAVALEALYALKRAGRVQPGPYDLTDAAKALLIEKWCAAIHEFVDAAMPVLDMLPDGPERGLTMLAVQGEIREAFGLTAPLPRARG